MSTGYDHIAFVNALTERFAKLPRAEQRRLINETVDLMFESGDHRSLTQILVHRLGGDAATIINDAEWAARPKGEH